MPTVAIVGDGCFVMNGGEPATVRERRLPVVFVVSDNASLGTIRMHQEQHYPDAVPPPTWRTLTSPQRRPGIEAALAPAQSEPGAIPAEAAERIAEVADIDSSPTSEGTLPGTGPPSTSARRPG